MNRRGFLRVLGLAPLAGMAAKVLGASESVSATATATPSGSPAVAVGTVGYFDDGMDHSADALGYFVVDINDWRCDGAIIWASPPYPST